MSNWQIVKLGELYSVHNGLSKGRQFFGTGYPFLTFSNVFNNWFLPNELDSLVQTTDKEREACSIKYGDVFITRTSETMNELGMSSVALKDYPDATYNGFTKRLRPFTDKVLPNYIGYYLRSPKFRGKFMAFSSMTTRASLANDNLLNMEIELPPMDVQKKIATILSRYDSLIDNYQKQIKLLEEAAQRLYKEWFAQNNNLETIKLVDISSKITDGVHNTVYNEEGSPYKLLSCKNVVGGHLMINSSERSISKDTFEKLRKRTQLEKGDILVSTVGSVGEVVYLDIEPNHIEFQRSVGIIKVDKNVVTPLYVYYSLLNRKNELKRTAHGAAQQCLFISDLKNFEILIGSKKQIQNFENFVKPISERITNVRHQLRLLTESRDRLLPKLLSGEIEV